MQIIGIGEKLYQLDAEEQRIYNRRYEVGRIADQKKKYASELEMYPDVQRARFHDSQLGEQQAILPERRNQRKRQMCQQYEEEFS